MKSHHHILAIVLLIFGAGVILFLVQSNAFQFLHFEKLQFSFQSLLPASFKGLFHVKPAEVVISPFYRALRIAFVSLGSGSAPYQEVFLRASFASPERIDVSGWKLVTSVRTEIIPQAIDTVEPVSPDPVDVNLKDGDTLHLYSDFGQNARTQSDAWEVHLNGTFLSIPHDTIRLFDAQGALVDEYTY